METTAAQLWRTWIESGVLRPRDYDRDIADLVRERLGALVPPRGPDGRDDVAEALDRAGWSPRQLIQALAPALASFSGLLRDLLALYVKVGARSGNGESLRIRYEFDPADPLDQQLAHFREHADLARRTAREARAQLVFDLAHAFQSPARTLGSWERAYELAGTTDLGSWPFARGLPAPVPTADKRADAVLNRWSMVIDAVLDVLAEMGETTAETTTWMSEQGLQPETLEGAVAQAATDLWAPLGAAALHTLSDAVRDGSADDGLIEAVSDWLDGFWVSATYDEVVQDLQDLLALPTWGKRHELYSAWITTQLDLALPPDRLNFMVVGGVLRFPFKATRLATLTSAEGLLELWCELRSPLADPVSAKRSGAIQPDYRVVRHGVGADPSAAVQGTVLAVEVKQYLRSAARRHAETVTDYAAGLPSASVLLVGHGPLGRNVARRVPVADLPRIAVFEHVRPDQEAEAAIFRTAIARLLPPPRGLPSRLELRWDPAVHDLDLHVTVPDGTVVNFQQQLTAYAALQQDAYDGGPEVVDVVPDLDGPVDVAVHLYSTDAASVAASAPELVVGWPDGGSVRLRCARASQDPRWWAACRLEADGRVVAGEDTDQLEEGDT